MSGIGAAEVNAVTAAEVLKEKTGRSTSSRGDGVGDAWAVKQRTGWGGDGSLGGFGHERMRLQLAWSEPAEWESEASVHRVSFAPMSSPRTGLGASRGKRVVPFGLGILVLFLVVHVQMVTVVTTLSSCSLLHGDSLTALRESTCSHRLERRVDGRRHRAESMVTLLS